MNLKPQIILSFILLVVLSGCSSPKNPINSLMKEIGPDKDFSIILEDMDMGGNFSRAYYHKYKILEMEDSVPEQRTTDWIEVPEDYFRANENNLGMEVAARNDGTVSRAAAPAGYHNYVGNSRYGRWDTNSRGESFWSFYGKYALLSTLLDMNRRPVYRGEYSTWNRDYRGSGRAYYGPTTAGSPKYGTRSSYTKSARPNFYARRQAKGGFTRSSSRVSRGSGRTGSSLRSRGGGFGK